MTKKTPKETRQKLLDAAITVLAGDPAQFTLDAIAAEAAVSKGGLLHHFPTKEAVVRGIVEYADRMWIERFSFELEQEPQGVPGHWSRAYIRASFELGQEKALLISALSKARSIYPDLLGGFESKDWQTDDDGLPPGRALVIRLTCDGLWFAQLFGTPPLATAQLAQIRTDLEYLTQSVQS